jgi:hypothetical protein
MSGTYKDGFLIGGLIGIFLGILLRAISERLEKDR